ncbi:MAG: lasso peptide biosynthesis protein [Bacteroidetes bacterium]|nr:lasso peptide biosynthesis protein [Bacteroidota bacterium]
MKTKKNLLRILIAFAILLGLMSSTHAQHERIYIAVEIGGVLCGYATTDVSNIDYKGMQMIETHDTVNLLLKALGQEMNMQIISRYVFYPETYKVALNHTQFKYDAGNIVSTLTEVFDDYALRTESPNETPDTIQDIAGVIFDNPLGAPYIVEDFVKGSAEEKEYRVYDYIRGHIADQKFTLLGEEDIMLAGQEYKTLLINIYSSTDGTNTKTWVNKDDGMTLRFEIMNRNIYLADESVIKRIKTVDLDNTIFARVDKSISNFMEMSYLKVSADIKSAGELISVESLNFPGQKFQGTVVENHIIGTFEIEPLWYDGTDAPAFPPDFNNNESLKKYLEPEMFIESDHPEITALAEEITSGSKDSWEAAVHLSEWVGKEIRGAIPGGTTAINTLKTRQGECGSHSRLLTAFCRAAGIPSRLSIGCMYSPWYGGSFGQHAWTEVYMGENIGWIAVDATIQEYDYVDAGHIKLGIGATFQPENMEILDYRIAGADTTSEISGIPPEYENIIGPYTNFDNRNVLEVQYADGGIGVDIMGRIVLALNDPDEDGRRYAKLSASVYFSFPEDSNGQVDEMIIVEKVYAMKNLNEEVAIDEETPEEFKAFMGPYVIMQIQKTFTMLWDQGRLAMLVPDVEEPRPLEKTDVEGRWRDPVDKKEYNLKKNADGSVSGMDIYVSSVLPKGATSAWIFDKTNESEGLEAAEKKYKALWDARALDLEFSEGDMNKLGYKYLGDDRFEEALMVFKLNVDSYPESWNVYDSYAEALMKSGEVEEAILNYEKSVELNPDNEHAKEMLEELTLETDK